MKKDMKENN